MNALKTFLAIAGAALSGCAATPEWNSEAAESVRPMRDMHRACMIGNTVGLDDGSQDPQEIAATVESLCGPLLEPMRAFIEQEGYGARVADHYVAESAEEDRREAAEGLLRARTEARSSP